MLLFTHQAFRSHVTPPGHPERVERLAAVERGLVGIAVERRECPHGDEAEVLRMFRTFNAASEPFRQESRRHEAARQEVAP